MPGGQAEEWPQQPAMAMIVRPPPPSPIFLGSRDGVVMVEWWFDPGCHVRLAPMACAACLLHALPAGGAEGGPEGAPVVGLEPCKAPPPCFLGAGVRFWQQQHEIRPDRAAGAGCLWGCGGALEGCPHFGVGEILDPGHTLIPWVLCVALGERDTWVGLTRYTRPFLCDPSPLPCGPSGGQPAGASQRQGMGGGDSLAWPQAAAAGHVGWWWVCGGGCRCCEVGWHGTRLLLLAVWWGGGGGVVGVGAVRW